MSKKQAHGPEPPKYSRGEGSKSIGDDRGIHFFNCLNFLFTDGVNDYAGNDRRKNFVEKNQHLFAGTVLCSMFAFLESTLGGKSTEGGTWINRHGGKAETELKCLRTVRNAFVHSNSYVGDLKNCSEDEKAQLRTFIKNLEAGKIKDDMGNTYPCYMTLSSDDMVTLNKHSIHIFTVLGRTISH